MSTTRTVRGDLVDPSPRRSSPFPQPGMTMPYLLFRTTPRDRWLLAMLAEHRVLTAEQITALAYRTLRSANRRLAALTQLKLVERFRTHPGQFGATPYHYVLGPAGALLVAGAHDLTPKAFGYDRGKLLRQAVRPDLRHTVGCNSLLIRLTAEHRAHPERRLERWWDQDSCTRVWGDVIRPDAYAVYSAPGAAGRRATCAFFFEYDTGSESLTQLAAKMAGYARHLDVYGGNRPVLIHLPDQSREMALHARLAATDLRPQIPVATTTAPRLAQPVWLPLGARARLAPPDLPGHFQSAGCRLLAAVHADPDVRAPTPVPDAAWI